MVVRWKVLPISYYCYYHPSASAKFQIRINLKPLSVNCFSLSPGQAYMLDKISCSHSGEHDKRWPGRNFNQWETWMICNWPITGLEIGFTWAWVRVCISYWHWGYIRYTRSIILSPCYSIIDVIGARWGLY